MNNNINVSVPVGKATFTFSDEDGNVFSSFRLNPTDVNVVKRCSEVADYFAKQTAPDLHTVEELASYNTQLEEKISYILGYDAREDVFGEVPATVILPSGEMFALVVLSTIVDAVKAETKKRNEKMNEVAAKYTAKYE